MKLLGVVDFWIRNINLDFVTDLDLDPGSIFSTYTLLRDRGL